jgi:putative pyruvate formate lyase activating enzyme
MSYPSYLDLYDQRVLQERTRVAVDQLAECRLCPRQCGFDRTVGRSSKCDTGRYARVSSFGPHHGEENCLRGWNGSGTVFFSGCNLRCVFCQNSTISQADGGEETAPDRLAQIMLNLQQRGCHNINLVTPSHVVPQILEALTIAVGLGLRLPLVYNSGGYDSDFELRLLDGVVDIYMPDLKFMEGQAADRYSNAPDYPEIAKSALREMHRQVGVLECGSDGLAGRGVLVRHLVMPGRLADTEKAMAFLAHEISPDTFVNLLAQYRPCWKSGDYPEIDRPLRAEEFDQALQAARKAGLHRFDRMQRPLRRA